MANLGMLLLLKAEEKEALLALASDREKIEFIQDLEERRYDEDRSEFVDALPLDKAWRGLHRALAGEREVEDDWWANTLLDDPLSQALLGDVYVLEDEVEAQWLMRLISPSMVRKIADALAGLTSEEYKRRYDHYCRGTLNFLDEDYLPYTQDYLEDLRRFYTEASGSGRWILFSVDW